MFTVEWAPAALSDLASLWTNANAAERAAINVATEQTDAALRNDPLSVGASRPGNRRIVIAPPLGLLFKVQPRIRLVLVLEVWAFRKKRG